MGLSVHIQIKDDSPAADVDYVYAVTVPIEIGNSVALDIRTAVTVAGQALLRSVAADLVRVLPPVYTPAPNAFDHHPDDIPL